MSECWWVATQSPTWVELSIYGQVKAIWWRGTCVEWTLDRHIDLGLIPALEALEFPS